MFWVPLFCYQKQHLNNVLEISYAVHQITGTQRLVLLFPRSCGQKDSLCLKIIIHNSGKLFVVIPMATSLFKVAGHIAHIACLSQHAAKVGNNASTKSTPDKLAHGQNATNRAKRTISIGTVLSIK